MCARPSVKALVARTKWARPSVTVSPAARGVLARPIGVGHRLIVQADHAQREPKARVIGTGQAVVAEAGHRLPLGQEERQDLGVPLSDRQQGRLAKQQLETRPVALRGRQPPDEGRRLVQRVKRLVERVAPAGRRREVPQVGDGLVGHHQHRPAAESPRHERQ
jgi:hypothetical protein